MQKGNVTVGSSGKKGLAGKARSRERYTRSKDPKIKRSNPTGPKVQRTKEPQGQDQGDRVFEASRIGKTREIGRERDVTSSPDS